MGGEPRSGRRILPIEVKLGAAVDHYAVAGLRRCMTDLSLKHGWVVSTATERRTIGANIEVIPWDAVVRGELDLGG